MGIKFTATAAGHVLGAAMFTIEIDNIRVLYTGDYSFEEDRHLSAAEVPPGSPPDVMIVESTFGTTNVPPRTDREAAFTTAVENIVSRGGSCLIPVFALGRAQELLLLLDEHWRKRTALHGIPIYYASKLATRSLRVYQTFINMMNTAVQTRAAKFLNPFHLRYIKSVSNIDAQTLPLLSSPSVVFASPGFLQSGVSRQLFEMWCEETQHGVIIAGYTIEGTLAHDLLSMPTTINCLDNRIKPRRCSIDYISFSAHVDYQQNRAFIRAVRPENIVLVHGEKNQMKRLKDALERDIEKTNWTSSATTTTGHHRPNVAMPENGVNVRLRFRKPVVANAVGSVGAALVKTLAAATDLTASSAGSSTSAEPVTTTIPQEAVLVTENFTAKVVSVAEMAQFTPCRFTKLQEKFVLPLPPEISQLYAHYAFQLSLELEDFSFSAAVTGGMTGEERLWLHSVREYLAQLYEEIEEVALGDQEYEDFLLYGTTSTTLSTTSSTSSTTSSAAVPLPTTRCKLVVQKLVAIHFAPGTAPGAEEGKSRAVHVTWMASPVSDMLADSIAGILLQYFSTTSLVKRSLQDHYQHLVTTLTNSSAGITSDSHPTGKKQSAYYHLKHTYRPPGKKTRPGAAQDGEGEEGEGVEGVKGDYGEFVLRMQRGEINPKNVIHFPFTAAASAAASSPDLFPDPHQTKHYLEQVQGQILQAHPGVFAAVDLVGGGAKLRFLGLSGQAYHWNEESQELAFSDRPAGDSQAEAYCFILFDARLLKETGGPGEGQGQEQQQQQQHHAVIESEEEDFRRFISWIFTTL